MTERRTTMSLTAAQRRSWLSEQDCDLDAFRAEVERTTDAADYPYATGVRQNVLVYDSERLRTAVTTPDGRREVLAELVRVFTDGPGIVVLQRAFADLSVVDRATAAFEALIADQRASGTVA